MEQEAGSSAESEATSSSGPSRPVLFAGASQGMFEGGGISQARAGEIAAKAGFTVVKKPTPEATLVVLGNGESAAAKKKIEAAKDVGAAVVAEKDFWKEIGANVTFYVPRQEPYVPPEVVPARRMYPIICSDCGEKAKVPFEPDGSRPVYCLDCYYERKAEANEADDYPVKRPSASTISIRPANGDWMSVVVLVLVILAALVYGYIHL